MTVPMKCFICLISTFLLIFKHEKHKTSVKQGFYVIQTGFKYSVMLRGFNWSRSSYAVISWGSLFLVFYSSDTMRDGRYFLVQAGCRHTLFTFIQSRHRAVPMHHLTYNSSRAFCFLCEVLSSNEAHLLHRLQTCKKIIFVREPNFGQKKLIVSIEGYKSQTQGVSCMNI